MGISFEKMRKKLGVTMLVKDDNAVKAKHGQYHLWLCVAKVSYFGQFGLDVPM